MRLWHISAATICSKWVGESEKLCRATFDVARKVAQQEASPCLIFIDEVDALLSASGGNKENESSRRLKTEMLVQLDGICSSITEVASSTDVHRHDVMFIAATNLPHELDTAFLRCMEKKIYVALPGHKTRAALISAQMDRHEQIRACLSNEELQNVATKTEGYSNSDLVHVCKSAAMVGLRRLIEVTPGGLACVLPGAEIPVGESHLLEAIRNVKATSSASGIQKIEDWFKNLSCD